MRIDSFDLLNHHICTLKETSKDDSDKDNIQYMTESVLDVVNFDSVKTAYANGIGLSEEVIKSVDAITQFGDEIVFIEFKNGKVENSNVKDKVRDSLLVFLDIVQKNISYSRESITLIVVYNANKNPERRQNTKPIIQEEPSLTFIGKNLAKKAGTEMVRFNLERYKKIYFKEVHTYSQEEFDSYLKMKIQ